jgi:hypothetical protein
VKPPSYLKRSTAPQVPRAQALRETLRADAALRSLTERARAAEQRLECVRLALPKGLHGAVLAGGTDEDGWTLLARNAAAAAKLRQLKPQLQMLLAERFGPGELRIKLLGVV